MAIYKMDDDFSIALKIPCWHFWLNLIQLEVFTSGSHHDRIYFNLDQLYLILLFMENIFYLPISLILIKFTNIVLIVLPYLIKTRKKGKQFSQPSHLLFWQYSLTDISLQRIYLHTCTHAIYSHESTYMET